MPSKIEHTPAITELLQTLSSQVHRSSALTHPDSQLRVIDSDGSAFEFNREQAAVILHSASTVRQLCEALDVPEDYAVELHSIEADQPVVAALECSFNSVDEM